MFSSRVSRLTTRIFVLCTLHIQAYGDSPQFSIGDTVCVTADERKLAQILSMEEDFAHYCSMVRSRMP